MSEGNVTVVKYIGDRSNYHCGYCKEEECRSYGMWTYQLTPEDYQDLINRGWRRSGQYCYKPDMPNTCCPSYTIKCDTRNFKPSKSQRKIIKRMNKFLLDGIHDKNEMSSKNNCDNEPRSTCDDPSEMNLIEMARNSSLSLNDFNFEKIIDTIKKTIYDNNPISMESTSSKIMTKPKLDELKESKSIEVDTCSSITPGLGLDSQKPPCKKAKLRRIEKKREKLAQKGIELTPKISKNIEKSLTDLFNETPENGVHKLKILTVPSEMGATEESFELYCKYQLSIHKDKPQKLTNRRYETFLVKSSMETTKTMNGPSVGYGSFHQQYWLDNKLIAVAVIDILPYCISSVYFFYDPDYNFLSLGTYGSLREINFTQKLCNESSELCYYYMGFYIHSCPKMRYKGKLNGSYLLCPEVFTWHLLDEKVIKKLEENKYQRLNENPTAEDEQKFTEDDLKLINLLVNTRFLSYQDYVSNGGSPNKSVYLEYGQLIGRRCANRMVLIVY